MHERTSFEPQLITCNYCKGQGHRSRGIGGGDTVARPCPRCHGSGKLSARQPPK